MAIGIRIKIPGITQEQFDAAHDHINPTRTAPKGLLFHSSGPIDGGWGMIDFWASREDFDAFQTRIGKGWQPPASPRRGRLTSRSSRFTKRFSPKSDLVGRASAR